jgi:hypothetical protein
MVPWYSGTSADLFKTMFDLLISVKLFLGRFDMRTMQVRLVWGSAAALLLLFFLTEPHSECMSGCTCVYGCDVVHAPESTHTLPPPLAAPCRLPLQLQWRSTQRTAHHGRAMASPLRTTQTDRCAHTLL